MSTGKPAKSAVRRQGIRDIVAVLSSYSLSPLQSNPPPTTCRMLMTYCHYFLLVLPSFSPTTKPKPKVSDTSHFFSLANNSLTEPYFASQSISSLSLSISKKLWEGHWGKKKGREALSSSSEGKFNISNIRELWGSQKMVDVECTCISIPSLLFPGKASQSCALCLGHIHATTNFSTFHLGTLTPCISQGSSEKQN